MPRPRSDSFRIKLSPNMAAVLSLSTKASISCMNRSTPASLTSPQCPHSTLVSAIPTSSEIVSATTGDDDSDDESDSTSNTTRSRRSSVPTRSRLLQSPVALCKPLETQCSLSSVSPASSAPTQSFSVPAARHHAYSPVRPSPLRRIASKPMYPSALYSTQSAQLPLFQPVPRTTSAQPVNPLSWAPETDRLHPRPSRVFIPLRKQVLKRALFDGPSGFSAKKFGVRGAWEVERDIRRAIEGGYDVHLADFSMEISQTRSTTSATTATRSAVSVRLPSSPSTVTLIPESAHKSDEEDEHSSSGSDGSEDPTSSGFYSSSSSEDEVDLHDASWELIPRSTKSSAIN